MTPAAAQALVALSPFSPRNRAEARALLSSWRHRDRLTAADVRAVLATYKR